MLEIVAVCLVITALLTASAVDGAADERAGYTYLLRVMAYVVILAAIIDKNLSARR